MISCLKGLSDLDAAAWTPGRFPLTDVLSWLLGRGKHCDGYRKCRTNGPESGIPRGEMVELNGCISLSCGRKPVRTLEDAKGSK
jgi:hypothetical protein